MVDLIREIRKNFMYEALDSSAWILIGVFAVLFVKTRY